MSRRAQQREETRERIVEAALACFAELGFQGASTREIARRAGANQGLITYHFRTKDELWRAATDRIFGRLRESLGTLSPTSAGEPRERARAAVRAYVRFAAAHPELFRLMVAEGRSDGARMRWLVDRHLRPFYQDFVQLGVSLGRSGDPAVAPHAYYVMAGAGSTIFAIAAECRRLTGLDPMQRDAIEAHAEFVARLLVP